MKKTITFLFAMAFAAMTFAQTPQEIISRMEEEMSKHENDGIIMTVDVKIPLFGTMSTKTYALGEKLRLEATMMGIDIITWSDETTEWEYNSKKNEVEIKKFDAAKVAEESGDAEMFSGITDDYDVTIKKETEDAWYMVCKKSKTSTDKDAPKSMDLVVAKGTYYPKSLSAKMSGVTMTMRDISFGVTERQVTFHIEDYPGITVIDKR